jgi:hypothetical protein
MEYAKALGQTREMLPTIRRCVSTAHAALEELKQSEALQLRRLEDLPSFADYASRCADQLDQLASELRRMPRSAVFAATILALRLIAAVNAIGDAAIDEMLHGRTLLSKVGLMSATMPGCLAVYHYRHALLADLPRSSSEAGESSGALLSLQKVEVLARNSRRMPPAFWLSIAISGSVALQVAKKISSRAIRGVLRFRMKLLLSLAALYVAFSRFDTDWASRLVLRWGRWLPPPAAEACALVLYRLQAVSARCVEILRALPLQGLLVATASLGTAQHAALSHGSPPCTAAAADEGVRGGPVFHGPTATALTGSCGGAATRRTPEGEEDSAGKDSALSNDQALD